MVGHVDFISAYDGLVLLVKGNMTMTIIGGGFKIAPTV
jgi:hypothetical protein